MNRKYLLIGVLCFSVSAILQASDRSTAVYALDAGSASKDVVAYSASKVSKWLPSGPGLGVKSNFESKFKNKFNEDLSTAIARVQGGGKDCFDWAQVGDPQTGPAKLMALIDHDGSSTVLAVDGSGVKDAKELDKTVLGKALNPLKGSKEVKAFAKAAEHYTK